MKQYKGYHGTNKNAFVSISKKNFNIPTYSFLVARKQKIPGDVGAGLYAYLDSSQNAFKFSFKFHEKEEIVVLELNLGVEEKKVLDMNEHQNEKFFLEFRNSKDFQVVSNRFHKVDGGSKRDCLDGIIIERIIQKTGAQVDLVIKDTYTQFKGEPAISQFKNGTELCIRNKNIITNYVEIDMKDLVL